MNIHRLCVVALSLTAALVIQIPGSLQAVVVAPCYAPHDCIDFECDEECPCPPGGGPGGNPGGPGCNSGRCPTRPVIGMPVWRVSEPAINLWIDDEPLGYQPAIGPRVSFKLSYKQREVGTGFDPSLFSVGKAWNFSWFSYVVPGQSVDYLHLPGGGRLTIPDCGTPPCPVEYYSRKRLVRPASPSDPYIVEHLDGTRDAYGFVVTNTSGAVLSAFLSQRTNASGQVLSFDYDSYDPNAPVVRLLSVTDAEGRVTTINYVTSHPFSTNLISSVVDPFGRTTTLLYDDSGFLTNIVDPENLSSSFQYDGHEWITNLTTPYGSTGFKFTNPSAQGWSGRAIEITEPNGGKHLYVNMDLASGVPESFNDVPSTSPFANTFDNSGMYYRNTFYWGPLQYQSLSSSYRSSGDISQLTSGDYFIARMRHWLKDSSGNLMGKTLSLERLPSPDGTTEGQKTWFDYSGKPVSDKEGTQIMPLFVARLLPDGNTWFERTERNEWSWATNQVSTYTKPDSAVGLRTNTFLYAANNIDMVLHVGPQGEQVLSNYFGNTFHQPDASYDALNQETLYTYNANRQLTSIKRPSGLTTTNIYFSSGTYAGWLDKTIDLEIQRTNSYTYDQGLVQTHTDERGLQVTHSWDALLRLTGMSFPDGTTTSNRYTALDLTATKDRLGFWTYFGYNGVRQKIVETNANGVVTGYGYCDCGALLSMTNAFNTPQQQITTFEYDYQGNRLRTYNADGYYVTNWFNSLGQLIATGDGWGARWFGYNNQGLLTSVTNGYADGVEQRTVYDIEDLPMWVTDANGVTVTNTYDALDRLRTRTYPDGGVERFGHTAKGLAAYTNQLNFVTLYDYDAAGRKTVETNANLEIIRYTNNAAGDLLSLTDGKNQTTRWRYDQYGRTTNKLDQAGTEILRYKYDSDNRLTNRWSAAKGNTAYSYDPVGNLTFINYPASTDVTFQYDALNRVTNMVDAVGTTKYTYTAANQLLTEDGPFANDTVTNKYLDRLRVGLSLQQPTGVWTNAFGYDAAHRLTNVTSPAGLFGYSLGGTVAGSPLPKRVSLPNGAYITNAYDTVARLTGTFLKNSGNTVLNSHQYLNNVGNQRTRQTFTDSSTADYAYDNIGQLQLANSSVNSEDRGYAYDAAWNLNWRTNNGVAVAFEVDGKNQLTSADYDEFLEYDANGNFYNQVDWYFSYDDENQLVAAEHAIEQWLETFQYDGQGRLRKHLTYEWVDDLDVQYWSLAGDTRYIYDGMRVIQELNFSTPAASYTRGNDLSGTLEGTGGIGGLLGRSAGYSSGNWTNHAYYHCDGNGNITRMLNAAQSLVASYKYDPFGNVLSKSGNLADANVYRFSSKPSTILGEGFYFAEELYYYGYRWYHPRHQRWQNSDPLGEAGFEALRNGAPDVEGDGANHYLFVKNTPVDMHDPFGLQFMPSHGWPKEPAKEDPCCSKSKCRAFCALLLGSTTIWLCELIPNPIGKKACKTATLAAGVACVASCEGCNDP